MRTRRPACSSISEIDASRLGSMKPRRRALSRWARVDQVDDLHVARQQPLHQRHRPALQRLGQQRVVGVGEGRLRDRPGLVPFEAVQVDEDAHQLRDGDRRMGVVELDRGVVAERADVAVLLDVAADEVEQRGGGEEIFLPQAQFLAGRRRVARIEHLRDRLGAHRVGERADVVAGVEGVELERIGRARRPQAQRVDVLAAPADDRRVVADRLDGFGRVPDVAACARRRHESFPPSRRSRWRN